jgi:hypothetical protein
MTPLMTMPAITPPVTLGSSPVFPTAADGVLFGASVSVVEVEAVEADDTLETGAVVGRPARLDDTAAPIICGNFTTPTLLVQQAVLSPQHHRSLSARPLSQGVIRAMPKESRTWSQTLRQLGLSMLSSAQKSTKNLDGALVSTVIL